jgi:hypothetical protein
MLFVATGFVVTSWRFWVDFFRFNTDTPYPLLAAVLILTYAFLMPRRRTPAATVAGSTFVALSPIHLPMLLLAMGCLFGRAGRTSRDIYRRNRGIIVVGLAATVAGVVAMLTPRLLASLGGYRRMGSGLLFRTGLDGSTMYFTDILQAVWSACPTGCCGSPRSMTTVLLPAAVPLIATAWLARGSDVARRVGGLGRMLLFLCVPYLVSAIFLPQAVSIHPYLYDHLLIVPFVVTGVVAMLTPPVRARLHGVGLLVFLLGAAAILMTNLLEIAQGLHTP